MPHSNTPTIDKETLERLYLGQRLSCRQIGEALGFTTRTVKYWLRRHNIIARGTMETIFPDVIRLTADELNHRYWHEWKSIKEIADECHADSAAVALWLKKFGIPTRAIWQTRRRGSTPIEPTQSELLTLYLKDNLSTTTIGKMYSLSAHVISDRMRAYGIPKRLPGYSQSRFTCSDGHVVRSTLEMTVDDWLSSHNLAHIYEPTLPFGGMGDFLVRDVFIEVWGITHNQRYDERRHEKIILYHRYGLSLIQLEPLQVMRTLESSLSVLIDLLFEQLPLPHIQESE